MKRFVLPFTLILSAVLLSACGAATPTPAETPMPPVTVDSPIIAEGRLEPIAYVDIAFSSSGVVDEVFVVEGQQVSADELLARLENTDLLENDVLRAEDDLARAEAQVLAELADAYKEFRTAQEQLDNYIPPAKYRDMTPTEAAEAALAAVNEARVNYEPYFGVEKPKKYAKDLKEELDNAWNYYNLVLTWINRENALEAAQVRLDQALAEYEKLQSGENIAAASQLSAAEVALNNAELRSPISGTVANLNIKAGEAVNTGQTDLTVADFSSWLIQTTDLTELDVVKISEGQTVSVTLDAIPDTTLSGTVLSIGQTFSESQGDVVYEVTIALDETDPAMRWGMTALVEFVEE